MTTSPVSTIQIAPSEILTGVSSGATSSPAIDKPMVSFRNVTKRYGNFTVLDGLELDVSAGEKVAIIRIEGVKLIVTAAGASEPAEENKEEKT